MKLKIIVFALCILTVACDSEIEEGVKKSDFSKDVEFVTDYGSIIMRLSDDTPKHRNNFIKLVNQKFYDSISFHRVIENFVIQTGDPETKNPNSDKEIGATDLPYRLDAEFKSNLFHKRGALSAAREGDDNNPSQSSSSTQFYIVQGKIYNDSTLERAQNRVNQWSAYNKLINKPEQKDKLAQLNILAKNYNDNKEAYTVIKDELDSLAKIELSMMKTYNYPEAHRNIYKTLGGTPHLDQNYTVFGEVVKGMNVVDSIAAVQTNDRDKPINDIRIISTKMIDRKDYNN